MAETWLDLIWLRLRTIMCLAGFGNNQCFLSYGDCFLDIYGVVLGLKNDYS